MVPFWKDVKEQVKEILGLDIPCYPGHFLLYIPPMPLSHYKKSALPHLLNAAKRILPIYWKRVQVPSREEWVGRVNEIREAEDWIATCKGTRDKLANIWSLWLDHVSGPAQVPSSLDMALLELAEPALSHRDRPQ